MSVGTEGVQFDGRFDLVALGKHTDWVDIDEVRTLAKRFVSTDFYSADPIYRANVTDNPTYRLSITIDGHSQRVEDYVGSWIGMPSVITELEDAVDTLGQTDRGINGSDGLVQSLQQEKFNFQTFEAQVLLKEAANRGKATTVQGMLAAGVTLDPLPAPAPTDPNESAPLETIGWLAAASSQPGALQAFIDAGASKSDQVDKNVALISAARSGKVDAVRALLAYGADPNADVSELTVTESSGGMTLRSEAPGSVLIYAAEPGNPEMVRIFLSFHPPLEARDRRGRTAIFAAGEYRFGDEDGARVECVRLLAVAGADGNARDNEGNTPLHEAFLTDVERELLELGADVNARNDVGETPIFTTVDDDAVPLFIEHRADLMIRNNAGKTILELANDKGPLRQQALRKAIQTPNNRE